jgi:hypothetical protein
MEGSQFNDAVLMKRWLKLAYHHKMISFGEFKSTGVEVVVPYIRSLSQYPSEGHEKNHRKSEVMVVGDRKRLEP